MTKSRRSEFTHNQFRRLRNAVFFWAFLLLSLSAVGSAAAEISVRSEVSPTSGAVNDVFLFTVTIEGTQRAPAPLLLGGQDFQLELLGPQTSVTIINGEMKSRVAYVYRLIPKRDGQLTTPTAEIDLGASKLTTEPITVSVSKSAVADPHTATQGDKLFIRQSATPLTAYQGQQVVDAVTVYTRIELKDPQLDDLTTDGFWQETIADDERSMKHIGGYSYTAVQVRKALFPLRTGAIQLPSRKLTAKVPDPQRRKGFRDFDPFQDDFFEQFFGGGPLQEMTASSNELTVTVKPLPSPPAEIAALLSAVPITGPTSIKADYSPDVINVGESKSVTVEVISEGNLNPLKAITLAAPPGIKIYEERPSTRMEGGKARLVMRKTFRFSLVPLRPGLFRIPGIKIAYFDPDAEQYKVTSTSDIAFAVQGKAIETVTPEPPAQSAAQPPAVTARPHVLATLPSVPPVGPPLRYEEPTLLEQISKGLSVQLAILTLAVAITIWTIVMLGGYLRKPIPREVVSSEEVRQAGDMKELEALFRRLLGSRLGTAPESAVDLLRALTGKQIRDRDTALAVTSLLDDFEVLRYGKPDSVTDRDLERLRTRLLEVRARLIV